MSDVTPVTLLYVALHGALFGIVAPVLFSIGYMMWDLHRRAIWSEDATPSGKAITYVKYTYYEADWRALFRSLPRLALGCAAVVVAGTIFFVGLVEVFVV